MLWTPYLIPFATSTAITVALFIYVLRFWETPVARSFAIVVGLGSLWSGLYVLDMVSLSLESKAFWSSLRLAFVAYIPAAMLSLALHHAGFGGLVKRWRILLLVVPVMTGVICMMGAQSDLMRYNFSLRLSGPLPVLLFSKGPWYFVHIAYSYILVILSFAILIRSLRGAKAYYRNRTLVVIGGFASLFFLDILFNLGITPLQGINPAPAAIAVAYLVIGWVLLRYRLLDIVPLAWSLVVENMEDPIFVLNRGDRIIDFNPRAKEVFSQGREAITGQTLSALAPGVEAFVSGAPELRSVSEEIVLPTAVGEVFFHASVLPVKDPDGRILGRIVVFHDVSELVKAREALQRAKEEAERADLAKSDFLATVSHEIRTPLNAIVGLTELLSETRDRERLVEYTMLLRSSGTLLCNLLNNILDISRIEAGKITTESVEFNPRHVIEANVEPFSVVARQKGLYFSLLLGDDLPTRADGDAFSIGRVLSNVVGNAIKFTDRGSIEVSAHAAVSAADPTALDLTVTVTDTGIGISPEMQDRVFHRFERGHDLPSLYPGTGLGLTIAKGLVEAMGGTIALKSSPSSGSTFSFTVPLRIPGVRQGTLPLPDEEQGKEKAPCSGADILLVEDNYFNQRVLGDLLRGRGHQVTVAAGGKDALDTAGRQRFDLVLMDIRMPDMDGFTVAQRLRVLGHKAAIIAVTADATEAVLKRCAEAGMDDVCVKPVQIDVLMDKIEALCGVPPVDRWSDANDLYDLFDPDVMPGLKGDGSSLQTYVRLLVGDIGRTVESLREAVDSLDFPAIARLAHTLKGTTAVIRIGNLSVLSKRIQEEAEAGDGPAIARRFAFLLDEHHRVTKLLEAHFGAAKTGEEG